MFGGKTGNADVDRVNLILQVFLLVMLLLNLFGLMSNGAQVNIVGALWSILMLLGLFIGMYGSITLSRGSLLVYKWFGYVVAVVTTVAVVLLLALFCVGGIGGVIALIILAAQGDMDVGGATGAIAGILIGLPCALLFTSGCGALSCGMFGYSAHLAGKVRTSLTQFGVNSEFDDNQFSQSYV